MKRLERLTADDRLVLWSDEAWPQDVGLVAVLDGAPLHEPSGRLRIEVARDAVARRLHVLPRLRQVLEVPRRGLGWPLFVDASSFDVDQHVRVAPVEAPGDETAFLRSVELLRRPRLDPSRPLWEMWFLPGLAGGRVGLFVRLHHVVADGIAGIASLAAMLDASPEGDGGPVAPWTPRPAPMTRDLLADNLRQRAEGLGHAARSASHPGRSLEHVRDAWPALRELLAGAPGPLTGLDGLVGPHRRLALVRAGMEDVRGVAHANGATVNDVLLAMIAGATRTLLAGRGETVDEVTLPILVPMSLRERRGEQAQGNRITQIIVPLPAGVGDPVERLHRITAATTARKSVARPALGAMFRTRLLSALMVKLIVRQHMNLLSANLPGPADPLYLAGARVLEAFPLINLLGNVTLGVGALSYAGQLGVLVVGDAAIYPDLDVFAAGLERQVQELVAASRVR